MATPIIAREGRGGKDGGGETRAMRGLELYRHRGDEIVAYLDGTYSVPSRTEEGVLYVVDLEAGTCDCPDSTYGGHVCLHQVFVEAHLAAKRREALVVRRRARFGSGRRCERRAA